MLPLTSVNIDVFFNFDTVYHEFLFSSMMKYTTFVNHGVAYVAMQIEIVQTCLNYGMITKGYSPGTLSLVQGSIYNFGLIDSVSIIGSGSLHNAGEFYYTQGFSPDVYTQSSLGTMHLDIRGTDGPGDGAGEYEQLNARFRTDLAGALQLYLSGYTPVDGDTFVVMTGLIDPDDRFDVLDLPDLGGCTFWRASYDDDRVTLSVVDSLDSDNDGLADCMDGCPLDPDKFDPGLCGCGVPDIDSDADGHPDCLDVDVQIIRQSNAITEGVRLSGHISNADTSLTWYLGSRTDQDTALMLMNKRNDLLQFGTASTVRMTIDTLGRVGIGRIPQSNMLEVNGEASKSSPGDWLANSDARLKTNIQYLDPFESLSRILRLKGIAYEWNDQQTGYDRPSGVQFGLTAQNVQAVFPGLVRKDDAGFLMTSYGTLDPVMIEAMRALQQKIEEMSRLNRTLVDRISLLERTIKNSGDGH
jgi:hypothetical protein